MIPTLPERILRAQLRSSYPSFPSLPSHCREPHARAGGRGGQVKISETGERDQRTGGGVAELKRQEILVRRIRVIQEIVSHTKIELRDGSAGSKVSLRAPCSACFS
jgi:hypothetical protein